MALGDPYQALGKTLSNTAGKDAKEAIGLRKTFAGSDADVSINTKAMGRLTAPADQIVIPVQGTDDEFFAQEWAVQLAASSGLRVRAFHVATSGTPAPQDAFVYLRRLCGKWGVPLETRILEGNVVDEIVNELGPRDLVIIGTRKMAKQYHMGSVAADLIRSAPCPIQVVRIP